MPTLLRLCLAGALLAALFSAVDLAGVRSILARVDPLWALPVLGLFGTGQVLSCVRWRLSLAQMVAAPPSVPTLLRLYLIGMFVNLGIPTTAGGDVARAEIVRGLTGTRGSAYASVLADRMIGALAVVLVAAGALVWGGGTVAPETRHIAFIAAIVLAAALVMAVLALLWAGARRRRWPRLAAFGEALRALARRPKIVTLSLMIAIVVQVVGVVLPIAIIARSMALDLPFTLHLLLVPIIVLITLVPVAPGGLGVRETAFVALYGQFGVSADAAFSLGIAWSAVLALYGLIGGGLLLLGRGHRDRSA
jgi:uncharacterized membrane protein YbhN (UPF0104 family)